MKCARCGKKPKDLVEYTTVSRELHITPDEYVREYDLTYDKEHDRFLCTPCWAYVGAPLHGLWEEL